MAQAQQGRVLYIVACAAPPTRDLQVLIRLAQADQWNVCVIATPSARSFLNAAQLERLTATPVRSDYKRPDEPDVFPPPDAIIVAPATFNTVNKWAAGISDTLALGVVCEAIGKGLPLVVLPFLNVDLAAHPAFEQSVQRLRSWGVTVLYGPGGFQPHPAGAGGQRATGVPLVARGSDGPRALHCREALVRTSHTSSRPALRAGNAHGRCLNWHSPTAQKPRSGLCEHFPPQASNAYCPFRTNGASYPSPGSAREPLRNEGGISSKTASPGISVMPDDGPPAQEVAPMLGPRRFGRLLALLAFVSILALVAFPAGARPPQVEVFPKSGSVQAARVDAVTVWNANAGQAALDACLAPANNPLHESRLYAAMHLAIHDALNAIDRRSRPYVFKTGAKPGASPDAAVAAAARDVLVPLLQQLPAPFSGLRHRQRRGQECG